MKWTLSLRARLLALFGAASLPLLVVSVLGMVCAVGNRASVAVFMLAFAVGLTVVSFGSYILVAKPLAALNASVKRWKAGTPLVPRKLGGVPFEMSELSASFQDATLALAQRESDLRVAIERQDLLMQEIHHRVKNNLQIVASLMNLQASRIRQPEARAEFQSARDRIRALATLHRHLYAHGDLHTINMRGFLVELCGQLFQAMGETLGDRIKLEIDAPELQMSSDQAVPLSLIVTEAVSNAIKYAFPAGRRGFIGVRLVQDGDDAELSIVDDGVGIPAGRVETESGLRDGIGITLIRGFARQLGATLTVEEGGGTRYLVRLKLARGRVERATPVPAA